MEPSSATSPVPTFGSDPSSENSHGAKPSMLARILKERYLVINSKRQMTVRKNSPDPNDFLAFEMPRPEDNPDTWDIFSNREGTRAWLVQQDVRVDDGFYIGTIKLVHLRLPNKLRRNNGMLRHGFIAKTDWRGRSF